MFRKSIGLTIIALLMQSCGRDGGVIDNIKISNIPGIFIVEDSKRTAPLTATVHLIYYVFDGERELIFKGSGGLNPRISLLNRHTLLITYCHGTVKEVNSFFDRRPNERQEVRVFQVQPVIARGLSVSGMPIC
jgi:hypothetical protein